MEPGARHDPTKHELLFVVIPMVSLSSDDGIGGGAVFALHHHFGGVAPLRDDISLRIFITDRLVQRHELRWEGLQVFDLPLRMWARIGFFSTLTQSFYGYGMGVTCDEGTARLAARDFGLEAGTKDFDDFVRRYYMMRYVRPHGDVVMRGRLRDKPHRIEALVGWRGAWYIPGSLLERGPWPGSLYAQEFPEGEPGFASTPQLGSRTMEVLAGPGAQVGHVLTPWLFGRQFDWASARNNVTALTFDPRRQRVEIAYQGDKGEVFHKAAYRRREDGGFQKVDEWLVKDADYDLVEG